FGDLIEVDGVTRSGQFKCEGTGELVKFAMFDTGTRFPAIRFQADNMESRGARLSDLALGQRYRFHMYQDARGEFNRCCFISDDYTHAALNTLNYQIQRLDLERGMGEVPCQGVRFQNYKKDTGAPPPYGHPLLRFTPQTRVWNNRTADSLAALA